MFEPEKIFVKIIFFTMLTSYCLGQVLQNPHIELDQGPLNGLKIFPDAARSAVYAFLGIPYAQPPTGELRFAPPQPHTGWKSTLQAMAMKPICPQLTNTIYDETPDGTLSRPAVMSEDCLYLNIWVPEGGMRMGNLPVLVVLTGEEMFYDWPRNRATGLDLASEGVVVVSLQYRTNIFGWISLGNSELPGNYGLQDQDLAFQWLRHNIQNFGGDPSQLTLLGHGTSGAPCALAHVLRQNPDKPHFSKLVLMSAGDMLGTLDSAPNIVKTTQLVVQKLGCQYEEDKKEVVTCLRRKSVGDIQNAFESVYDHGNSTCTFGPIVKPQLQELLSNRTRDRQLPPLLMGIASNEGAFLQDYWLDLAREGYAALRAYVNYTVLPHVLRNMGVMGRAGKITDALNWRYFSGEAAVNVGHLLGSMQRLISESFYETPFYRTLEQLSQYNGSGTSQLYAYIFEVTNSMDMRGKVNLFGGASHTADLPLLLGPSLYQQIARRRFTPEEEKLCQKMRGLVVNFLKTGIPTPGRMYDAWLPYTKEQKFIYNIGRSSEKESGSTSLEKNLPQIMQLIATEKSSGVGLSRTNRNEFNNPYQLGVGQASMDSRMTRTNTYLVNQEASGYALHLKRVYGFWQMLLPNMAAFDNENYDGINEALNNRMRLIEVSADAARYRRGFFTMLGLVVVLLAILSLCVYLLRRDPLGMPSTSRSSGFCL